MNKSTVIRIRLDNEILETVRQLAQANDRTIAKQIQFTIKQTHPKLSEYAYYQDEIIAYLISVHDGSLDTFNTMNEATRLLKLIKETK